MFKIQNQSHMRFETLRSMILCSDACSTEMASLTLERLAQSMSTQEVTSKNT